MQRKQRKACVRPRNHSPSVRLGHVCTHQSSQLSKSEESKKEKQGQQSRQLSERNSRKQREHAPPPYTSNPSPAESPGNQASWAPRRTQPAQSSPPTSQPSNTVGIRVVSRQLESKSKSALLDHAHTHHHHGPHQRRPLIGLRAAVSPRCRDPTRFTQQHQDPAKPAFGRASTARLASGTRGAREAEQTKDYLDMCVCVCALVRTPQGVLCLGSHTAVRACMPLASQGSHARRRFWPCHAMPWHAGRRLQRRLHALAGWLAGWTGLAGCGGGGRWWLRTRRALCVADAASFASPRHATPCRQVAGAGAVAGSNGRCVARRDLLRGLFARALG
jgi:hypothetical protein